MPAVPPEQRQATRRSGARWGASSARSPSACAARGSVFGYHNHHWELAPKEGAKTALELIFEEAAGSPLAWQVDIVWLVRGGADPKEWMQRYRDRVVSAHVKDIAPQERNEDQDGWADIGAGVLDWQATRAAGARWMMVEHDKPADAAETACQLRFHQRMGV
jgi:sugar phosphate isomerase/epimerase